MNDKYTVYEETNQREIAELLVGRRIVSAELGSFDYPGLLTWRDPAEGRLELDDGTELYLVGNYGCGGCTSGHYRLEKVATVDNIITSARVEAKFADYGNDAYRIFVFANGQEINVAEFIGDDGNGYYGTGFSLIVVPNII